MLKELRDLHSMAVSILIMTAVSSWMLTLSLGLTIVGAQASGTDAGAQFAAIGGLQIALTCMSVMLCAPSVVRLAIRQDSRRVALWQVIGASPRQARWRYVLLASLSSLVGSLLGAFLGYISWPAFTDMVKRTGFLLTPGLASESINIGALVSGPLSSFGVVLLATLFGSASMSTIDPVQAVAEVPEQRGKTGVLRLFLSIAIVGGVAAGYIAIANTSPVTNPDTLGGLISAYWGAALGLLLAYGISDKALVRPVVRLVGALFSFTKSDSWFIAKTSACRRSIVSTSVITPLVVAASSVGSVFGMVAQTKNVSVALGQSEEELQVSPPGQIILIFGLPVIIAASSAIVSVYLTSRLRNHDITLLEVLGAQPSTIRAAAVCESLIYYMSSTIIAFLILAVNACVMGKVLAAGPVPHASPVWFGGETFLLLTVSFILLSISIIVPTMRSSSELNVTTLTR
ncbi:FtsX-like permease family protein [Corynebacterium kroppenstedtii]|nr:FtsX-like permease family protein [Corynebacterium kroppenstedtii]MDU7286223.1 FtsX-like permease family protein [Corynebacterium kroppenstedtii]